MTGRASRGCHLHHRRGLPARRVRRVALVAICAWPTAGRRRPKGTTHPPMPSDTPAVRRAARAVRLGAALVSDWFVAALDPAVTALGISKAFTGLVIVGIAGNAVEKSSASRWR